jgi:hypothetical protein
MFFSDTRITIYIVKTVKILNEGNISKENSQCTVSHCSLLMNYESNMRWFILKVKRKSWRFKCLYF